MFNTTPSKSEKLIIHRMTHAEAFASVRKVAVRAGQSHRDKRNDYKRKPKHFSGWE